MDIARRNFLAGGASAVMSLGVGACAGLVRPVQPICANDPSTSDPLAPLTIDVHAHVFNGSDLQVNEFLTRVLGIGGIGPFLQNLAWSDAPNAQRELGELARVSPILRQCDVATFRQILDQHRRQQYRIGREQLVASVRRVQRTQTALTASGSEFARQVQGLPEDYESYRRSKTLRNLTATKATLTAKGAIDFILRNFQYRYVNVFDYLKEYSSGRERRVDLITAHLIDYDWPIGDGKSTETSLPDQIRVMSEISALTSGRVHCFAPFDPFKQVAYELGLNSYSPLVVASDAILNKGFFGIKMYPPMGFQPFGNSLKPTSFWTDAYLPAGVLTADLGQRLDRVLGDLYQWCLSNDVPIMAHSAPTNSPTKHVSDLTDPAWWDLALQRYPNLRVNFGHFGETEEVKNGIDRPLLFAALMNSMGRGENVYADLAYFTDAIRQPDKLLANLRRLLRATSQKGSAALAQRLMYGSDWEMITVEGHSSERYLKNFEDMFAKLDTEPTLGAQGRLSDRFFGQNAAEFLGLHKDDANRNCMEAYYVKSGVGSSPLLAKVDKTPLLVSKQ